MTTVLHSSGGQNHQRIPTPHHDAPPAMPAIDDGNDGLDISAGQKMLSAMSGSILTSLLVTPLDVVRVRLQSQQIRPPSVDFSKLALTTPSLTAARAADLGVTACCREVFFTNNNSSYCVAIPRPNGSAATTSAAAAAPVECAVEEAQKKTISSTMDGLRKIARNEGVTTLWRGLSPTLVMAIPANIIYFTGYDWLRYSPRSPFSGFGDNYSPLTSGTVARITAAFAVSPIELFRTRLQATTGTSATGYLRETLQGIQQMVAAQGYRTLWRGLTLTLWRDVPFSGFYWWGYESARGKLTDLREARQRPGADAPDARGTARRRSQSRENHADTFLDSFAAGAVSGAFASIITMPFDVGKTRTQVYRDAPRQAAEPGAAAAPEVQSMTRLLWHIFKTEGVPGLWRGWIPRTLKVAPACAIMISSYELGKKVFRGVNERAVEKGMA